MVVQKTIDNLKDKPKDERKALAGGIAFAVVILLFFAWAFFFFKKIQRGAQLREFGGGAQEEVNFSAVREAQQKLLEGVSDTDELRTLRDQAAERQMDQSVREEYQGSGDAFGGEGAIE